MNPTWNQQLIKKENKTIVLQLIMQNAPISRADIALKSGLNKGTVSTLVAELIEEQLIIETGPGVSSGGRRPVMLVFNENAGSTIGIDLGVNYILGILTDLQGNIIEKKRHSFNPTSFEHTMKQIHEDVQELISKAPKTPYGIVGIGVGAPGIVDNNSSVVLAPNLGWKNSFLKEGIEEAFQIPVIIENEANAGAYGEKMFGLGKSIDNLVYISTGIGIGTGIIMNEKLYRGSSGFSGEFGHMTINMNGETCRCGNKGCWELYASEQYVIQKALKLQLVSDENANIDQIIELAEHENDTAIELLKETAIHLGMGIVNIVHALNPQKIIVGNRLAGAKPWMEQIVQKYVKNRAMTSHQNEVKVQFSDPSFPATALGVAAFSVEHFLKRSLEKIYPTS
ncbi:ROK family protein [Lederbergia wuyishanensis]|uniref:Glucokinase-like ROK family protein n=1 Tax=Lederbergia wuyishanensis TaxID=1347903 RepID=A0ABU0CZ56_9BACI|nr:ROK family transcriptional regulator [Lederbergia wuyishanensis]MCJ8006046.1 ROK family transcriptional regulator [Lederbergia wuyishanensis]MDQ0341415.1 glucokinase-like ROK family protein [Lederbergia wuyishanensis]